MRKYICLLIVLMSFPVASNALTIDATWIFQIHTYTAYGFENEAKDWENARSLLPVGDYLATITSQPEQDALNSALTAANPGGEYWLGGFQTDSTDEPAGNWAWITAEPWSFTSWINNEPNNAGGGEQHLAVWQTGWNWNDEGNLGNITGFIGESAPVPEPATMVLFGLGILGLAGISRKRLKK